MTGAAEIADQEAGSIAKSLAQAGFVPLRDLGCVDETDRLGDLIDGLRGSFCCDQNVLIDASEFKGDRDGLVASDSERELAETGRVNLDQEAAARVDCEAKSTGFGACGA